MESSDGVRVRESSEGTEGESLEIVGLLNERDGGMLGGGGTVGSEAERVTRGGNKSCDDVDGLVDSCHIPVTKP
jgi:hypothetical protein